MSALFDHEIIEPLHSSARSLVQRARAADGSGLIVKVPNQQFPSFQQLAQFKREYAIARLCRHPGVIHPLALQLHGGRWTMLQEDIGGQALDRLLRAQLAKRQAPSHPALALDDFFDIALQLCAALDAVHRQGIIHKDINPSNLVWNAERRLLQLIDFGIACELPYENHDGISLRDLEGTLHYMAPEQTGRMNRRIDYRADYYALGATFYELLTGQTPFAARDEIELVHCHIARSPDWSHPSLRDLPGQLPAIIRRLLEKNADQRYQSLQGLKSDLEACRAPQPAQASGLSNHNGRLLVPQTLHGREDAIALLLAAFGRSAAGASEMLLVAGHSGIGKSAVVNEVQKSIIARRGYFLSGKFDQLQRDMPYASLIQAFQGLVHQLLGQPEEALREWSRKLQHALGNGIGVIVELIPQLALITGPAATASSASLAPEQAQHRLDRLFPRFVEVFATAAHPLVLFLDDLQWADAATLRMIERLMLACDKCCLLFIGAYRSNEVGAMHPLALLRDKLLARDVRMTTLVLKALSEPQVAQMVSATVRVAGHDCAALTSICYTKTAGNPFFLNQFLESLNQDGHLRYRAAGDCWDWDLPAIEQARYTDNVVEVLLEKIRRLPAATRHLLQLAASCGNRYTLATLALAVERTPGQTQRDLWPALHAGLILPLDERYKYIGGEEDAGHHGVSYQFLHDRVQQAAYLLADAATRAQHHLLLGRLLLHTANGQQDGTVFHIVEQLNAGRALITDPGERLQLAALNLQAGVEARRSAAFQATLQHMQIGLGLLPDDAWRVHAGLWLDLQLGAAEAAYLCGQFEAAEAIYPLVRARALAPLCQVRCIAIQSHQYQLQGRLPEAIAVQRDALAQLGMQIPHEVAQLKTRFEAIVADIGRLSGARTPGTLLAAGDMAGPADLAAMKMMHGMWMAAYYAGQQDLSALMVVSMTRLSMERGNSDFSAVAYVAYAMLLAQHSGDAARGHDFGAMALLLARRRANLQTRTQTGLMFAALVNHWTRPLRSSDALYEEAFGWALEIADFVQVGVVAAVRATERIILGDYLPQLLHDTEHDLALMRANGQQAMADCCAAGAIQPIKCLMGLSASHDSYDDATFSEARFLEQYGDSVLYRAYLLQGRLRNAWLFDTAGAEALAARLDLITRIMRGQAKVVESSFYAALIWIRALRRDPARADAHDILNVIAALQEQLAQWASQGSDHGGIKHLLVMAELARYRHDLPQATRLYQEAIDAAALAGYVNLQALGNELCGDCWCDQGQARVAAVFIRDALAHYGQWGAQGKVAQLQARHAALLSREEACAMTLHAGSRTRDSRAHNSTALDMVSLLKAAQILSNEVGLRNVLARLIAIVCENAGAQVARLLLLSDGAWHLEADMDGEAVTVLQARRLDLDAAGDPQFPLSLLRYVIRTGQEVIEDSMTGTARFGGDPYVQQQRPRAVMCLPIRHAGRIDGILYFENRLAEASFTEERVAFLRMLGAQAMISISSARLHDSLEQRVAERTEQLEDANRKLAALSITDGLTGLANRRHFDEVLRAECTRSRRAGQSLAVMMLDVDYFKRYNDRYGHQAGDACLIRVAQALGGCLQRASDLVARYGGEEFSMVLPNTGADEARQIGEALRRAIEELQIVHAAADAQQVTISIGIAIEPAVGTADPDALLRLADAALYQAKDAGRNCVMVMHPL